jgi:hypothetical protein
LKTDKRSREGQKQRTTLRREGEPPAKQLPQFPYCHQHPELSAAQPRQREEDVVDKGNTHGQEEQQQHHQRHCQVLEVKTKKERKEEEPPVTVCIAATSATLKQPPAATILPVIDNRPAP